MPRAFGQNPPCNSTYTQRAAQQYSICVDPPSSVRGRGPLNKNARSPHAAGLEHVTCFVAVREVLCFNHLMIWCCLPHSICHCVISTKLLFTDIGRPKKCKCVSAKPRNSNNARVSHGSYTQILELGFALHAFVCSHLPYHQARTIRLPGFGVYLEPKPLPWVMLPLYPPLNPNNVRRHCRGSPCHGLPWVLHRGCTGCS